MSENVHMQAPLQTSGPAPEVAGVVAILIHGRTQSPADMFAIAQRLGTPDLACVAVEAAGNSWYPDKFMAPLASNQPFLDFALERIELLVVQLEECGIARSQIVLIGFSQGACLACEYLYRHPARWGGLIAYTGGLIGPEGTSWLTPGILWGTPVFLGNSDEDVWVPLSRTVETVRVFERMGADVQLAVYPGMGHLVNDEEISLGRALVQSLLNRIS
ncbi:dienelactone hydrolase family protein [Pseudomonas sp. 13B_2.1_Bac1]|uniref:alpha/beta hydrolase n=1 Tax=Pseudomonas sp. 13B_2.1_Bac1 TaxID=2971624 RepID=UPI0021CAA1AD|nr:dienelactone hydrolase family protein [Pseudomonas sp. 13B_2.1_Bac1]MCU1785209.1 dienelactone hydrolase family protein [Pseudomonas sp. 13B_2.1_Bac1]